MTSHTPEKPPEQPAVARAEEVIDRVGHHLGLFAGLTVERVQSTASALRRKAAQMTQPKMEEKQVSQPTVTQAEEPGKPAREKAELLVDSMGQRLGLFGMHLSLQVQKAGARVREEAEDMWAEAQNIRSGSSRKSQ